MSHEDRVMLPISCQWFRDKDPMKYFPAQRVVYSKLETLEQGDSQMSIKKLVYTSAAASLMLLAGYSPSAYASNTGAKQACILDRHAPVAVAPYTVDHGADWGSYSSSGGAQLFVPASEGLTKELLAASMQKAVAAAKAQASGQKSSDASSCNLPRIDVHVSVVSAGNGYWVQLMGHHPETSEVMMKWARNFISPTG